MPPQQNTPTPPFNTPPVSPFVTPPPRRKKWPFIVGGVLVLLAAVVFVLTQANSPNEQDPSVPTLSSETTISIPAGDVFIDYIPRIGEANAGGGIHRDALGNIDVIPRLYERRLRGKYAMGDRLFLVGSDKILVYDTATKKIVSQNDPAVIDCAYSSARYSHWLFVACNSDMRGAEQTGNFGKIYRIDLNTNKVDKIYTPGNTRDILYSSNAVGDPLPPSTGEWVNISLLVNESGLWMANSYGVFRFNLEQGGGAFYPASKLGYTAKQRPGYIYEENGGVKVTTEFTGGINGISEYDPMTNTWEFVQYATGEFDRVYMKLLGKDGELPSFLPHFSTLSNPLEGGRYYLTERNAMYVIPRGKMPELFVRTNQPLEHSGNLFVGPDEDNAALFFKQMEGEDTYGPFRVLTVNLKTGVVENLALSTQQTQEVEDFFVRAGADHFGTIEDAVPWNVASYSDHIEITRSSSRDVLRVYFTPAKIVVALSDGMD